MPYRISCNWPGLTLMWSSSAEREALGIAVGAQLAGMRSALVPGHAKFRHWQSLEQLGLAGT
jgi:hypothetical protein